MGEEEEDGDWTGDGGVLLLGSVTFLYVLHCTNTSIVFVIPLIREGGRTFRRRACLPQEGGEVSRRLPLCLLLCHTHLPLPTFNLTSFHTSVSSCLSWEEVGGLQSPHTNPHAPHCTCLLPAIHITLSCHCYYFLLHAPAPLACLPLLPSHCIPHSFTLSYVMGSSSALCHSASACHTCLYLHHY